MCDNCFPSTCFEEGGIMERFELDLSKKSILIIVAASSAIITASIITATILIVVAYTRVIPAEEVIEHLLDDYPIFDGHNDLPWNLRRLVYNDLRRINLKGNLELDSVWGHENYSHTDIPRLHKGQVGAQFWVAWVDCESQYKDAVGQTLEQIDVIKRMTENYPDDLQFATSVADIEDAMRNRKIASLIGVEGGHSIQFSFGILRSLYALGARYMTLTHSCNTPWADSSPVDGTESSIPSESNGLSTFGLEVIEEMNRLGMIVDISHTSAETMRQALNHSKAPVIFSHSAARGLCDHHRNVPDDVLQLVKETSSVVLVNFYPQFIRCDGEPATLMDVARHIDYIKNMTGAENVGIGSDFDGVDETPIGLEDVSKYPDLLIALYETGRWTVEELRMLSNENMLRVFKDVERVRDELTDEKPCEDSLKQQDLENYNVNMACITGKFEVLKAKERRTARQLLLLDQM